MKRLEGYHGQTVPILAHYEPTGVLKPVNANQKPDLIWGEIQTVLGLSTARAAPGSPNATSRPSSRPCDRT